MDEEKRRFSPPMVGGSSLLVIFAILCLTIFALLSLSTVQADERLDKAAVGAVSNYYAADREAETILAKLRGGNVPEGVEISNGDFTTASYTCRISDTEDLVVVVEFRGGLGDDYTILRWQAVSTVEWMPDEDIDLWDGDLDLWDGGPLD